MVVFLFVKDKGPIRHGADAALPQALRLVREHVHGLSGLLVLWSLFSTGLAICLLKGLFSGSSGSAKPKPAPVEPKSKRDKDKPAPASEKKEPLREEARPSNGGKENSEERAADSDRSPRKRK